MALRLDQAARSLSLSEISTTIWKNWNASLPNFACNGPTTNPKGVHAMKKYHVKVIVRTLELYEI